MIGKIKSFTNEIVAEMKKVSWPTREQLKESTVVVIVMTLLITAIVWVIDTGLTEVLKAIFS
jgi:preprotein translocase subunit SecE